ncbi:hypothetical protein [Corallococcus exercitus]|uniref:Uncharacterized protein n=1 Tax=Corallococcus exercitus TaxID=2316736 RepID=A0A7Y4NG76_9BACT|nr:hypothetical protein [Corallococcus exercitus]NOK12759.1 hypothetical protein [Corallococcus exercitus]
MRILWVLGGMVLGSALTLIAGAVSSPCWRTVGESGARTREVLEPERVVSSDP